MFIYMNFGSPGDREDGEHTGVGLVEIFRVYAMLLHLSSKRKHSNELSSDSSIDSSSIGSGGEISTAKFEAQVVVGFDYSDAECKHS